MRYSMRRRRWRAATTVAGTAPSLGIVPTNFPFPKIAAQAVSPYDGLPTRRRRLRDHGLHRRERL
eukprot:6205589-Pleurochrysis_carterae.AAC.1